MNIISVITVGSYGTSIEHFSDMQKAQIRLIETMMHNNENLIEDDEYEEINSLFENGKLQEAEDRINEILEEINSNDIAWSHISQAEFNPE